MLVYRLAAEQYIHDISGTGARLFGGRWNRKGTSLLYTSEHYSLALLEVIVNTPKKLLPDKLHLFKLYIPEDFEVASLNLEQLPENWQQYPAPDTLAEIGTRWATGQESAALKVPSVIVPDEWNILLNPDHPDFKEISIESVSPFTLDSRF